MSRAGKTIEFKAPVSKLAEGADLWITDRKAEPASDREGGTVSQLHAQEPAPQPEAVAQAEAPKEKMSRFTIDVPESLHRRVKMQCAGRGQKMADMMRELLEREFPAA